MCPALISLPMGVNDWSNSGFGAQSIRVLADCHCSEYSCCDHFLLHGPVGLTGLGSLSMSEAGPE